MSSTPTPSSLIWVDEKDFKVYCRHSPSEGFLPSEESIAIVKYAELIKKQIDEFLETKHNPMVKRLIEMVAAYNQKNSADYIAKLKGQMDEKASELLGEKDAALAKKENLVTLSSRAPTGKKTVSKSKKGTDKDKVSPALTKQNKKK